MFCVCFPPPFSSGERLRHSYKQTTIEELRRASKNWAQTLSPNKTKQQNSDLYIKWHKVVGKYLKLV